MRKQKMTIIPKRILVFILTLAMLAQLSLIFDLTAYAVEYPTTLINGGFEYPTLSASGGGWWTNYNPPVGVEAQFGWKTTAQNTPKFEFGGDWNVTGWGIQFIPEGRQFIELNPTEQAAVYQDLSTTPGTVIYWSLYQGGVWYSNSTNINNTMAVRIGTPDQLPHATMKDIDTTNYDQLWINRTIYEIANKSVVNTIPASYIDKDNNKLQLYTEPKRWTKYEGIYVVPEGQTLTRFAFASLSPIPEQGNLLDGVVFRVATQEEVESLDPNPPVIGMPIGNPSEWTNIDPTISFTVVDNESAVSSVKVSGSKSGEKVVSQEGITYSFTATQNDIYTITAIDNAGNTATKEVEVTYMVPTLSYSVIGTNGSLSATVDGATISNNDNIDAGKDAVFTAVPNYGYLVKGWKIDDIQVSDNTSNTYTLLNISTDSKVEVEFEVDTDTQAVAAAKTAIVSGTVNVEFGADQGVKTAAVQSYVNGLLTGDAAGVDAIVTCDSENNYKIEISKGSVEDSKTITMTIVEDADPDIATVSAAKTAAEGAIYSDMTQAMATNDGAIKNALKLAAEAAINDNNVTTTINEVSYTEAIAGTSATPTGTGGFYKFTVTVSKGAQSAITIEKTISIVATPYAALPIYKVEGTVKDQDNNIISSATIRLMSGKNQTSLSTQTDGDGKFVIENVLNGTYNIVISKESIIMTKVISVRDANYAAGTISLLNGKRNSVVEIKGSITPEIVVGGLDNQFHGTTSDKNDKGITALDNSVIINGGSVEIKLTAEKKDDLAANASTISATATLSGKTVGIFIDLSVVKTVTDSNGDEIPSQSAIFTELPSLIDVYIPLPTSLQGKSNYAVYRYHGSDVDSITTTANTDGEKIEFVDNNTTIKLTVKKFSTYAIAYTTPITTNTGNSSGNDTSRGIEASKSLGGDITISTDKKNAIITPDDGYVIADVIFDEKSIGAVETYTVTDRDTHTIKAKFVKEMAIPYYFEQDKKVYIGFSATDENIYQYLAPFGVTVEFEENRKNFEDNTVAWAKPSIDFVTEREIFLGTSQGMFSPNESMTRAMFVAVIGRLYERSYGIVSGTDTFTDVDANSYYAKYVAWANENGIIKGVGENKFAPNNEVTREQMAVIILKFATLLLKTEGLDSSLEYTDSTSISSWAIEGAKYCQETNVITGRNGGNFAPQESATRAEVAVVFERFINKIVSSSK